MLFSNLRFDLKEHLILFFEHKSYQFSHFTYFILYLLLIAIGGDSNFAGVP